ncbi:MAG TPA: alpha/beta hydrolase [Ktedonobacteraceae bacterium]|nr:alpha/beta hydrolase [Ktedonobacteraceae bacterium]
MNIYEQSDGYSTHYRLWGPDHGDDLIVILHGGMSHSEWQEPLAEAILARSGVSFIATDRRGSGLNMQDRGHMDSSERVINDVVEFLQSLRKSFTRVHLAGWCFGGQLASAVAERVADKGIISTLILIAPGFFYNERYNDVLWLSVEAARQAVAEFNLNPEPSRAYIQLPLQSTDFTVRPDWQRFIANDKLRLTKISEGTIQVSEEIAEQAERAFPKIGNIPVLVVFGTEDRLLDVERVREFVLRRKSLVVENLPTGHAVQFEQPEKLAEVVLSFLSKAR